MTRRHRLTAVALLVAAALVAGGCSSSSKGGANSSSSKPMSTVPGPRAIVPAIAYDADLSTFSTALNVAGLVPALRKGPFTVFVPNNEAFAKLARGRLNSLLKASARPELARILRFHIVSGTPRKKLVTGSLKTTNGAILHVKVSGGKVLLADAHGLFSVRVVGSPIVATNGVIYVISAVLSPR